MPSPKRLRARTYCKYPIIESDRQLTKSSNCMGADPEETDYLGARPVKKGSRQCSKPDSTKNKSDSGSTACLLPSASSKAGSKPEDPSKALSALSTRSKVPSSITGGHWYCQSLKYLSETIRSIFLDEVWTLACFPSSFTHFPIFCTYAHLLRRHIILSQVEQLSTLWWMSIWCYFTLTKHCSMNTIDTKNVLLLWTSQEQTRSSAKWSFD